MTGVFGGRTDTSWVSGSSGNSGGPPDKLGRWDHDHCDFCWAKFSDHPLEGDDPPTQLAGYATEDGAIWICPSCMTDFLDRFQLVVEDGQVSGA